MPVDTAPGAVLAAMPVLTSGEEAGALPPNHGQI